MKAAKVLIVEDEMVLAMDLHSMLLAMGYDALEPVIGYTEALEVLEDEQPDLALLDISLGGQKDGIDLAQHIREHYHMPLIFTTSHADAATVERAVSVQPNGYLVKPFEQENLFTAIESAMANFGAAASGQATTAAQSTEQKVLADSIFVRTDRLFVKVKTADILWLKSDKNYLDVVTAEKTYVVRSSFDELLSGIGNDFFVRVHKSYFVNLHKVDAINHAFLQIGDAEVPLSRNYRDEVYQLLKRFS